MLVSRSTSASSALLLLPPAGFAGLGAAGVVAATGGLVAGGAAALVGVGVGVRVGVRGSDGVGVDGRGVDAACGAWVARGVAVVGAAVAVRLAAVVEAWASGTRGAAGRAAAIGVTLACPAAGDARPEWDVPVEAAASGEAASFDEAGASEGAPSVAPGWPNEAPVNGPITARWSPLLHPAAITPVSATAAVRARVLPVLPVLLVLLVLAVLAVLADLIA